MATRFSCTLVLLGLFGSLVADETRPTSPVSSAAADANAPLPPGAVMRLGETRFRPGARVQYLAFSPDGKQLASVGNWGDFEDRLSLWDVASGRELQTEPLGEHQIADLRWGSDRRAFAALKTTDSFGLWQFSQSDSRRTPWAPPGWVYGLLALSADDGRVAAFRSTGAKGQVELYEAKPCVSASELKQIAVRELPMNQAKGLRFTRRGKTLVILLSGAGKGEQSVILWDTEKDSLSEPVTVSLGVCQGTRQSFDVTDDGSALAIGLESGAIRVYELPSGKERLNAAKHDGPKHGGKWSEVSAVKFVNGGRNLLSAGRDGRQLVWDAKTGADVATLNGHSFWVEAVAVSPDGKRVATAGQDSLIRLWDAATWQPLLPPQGARNTIWRLEVSRDGRYAACGSGDGIHVWEMASAREVLSAPSDYRSGLVLFAPDGGAIAGNAEGDLTLHPLPRGAAKALAAKGRLLDFTPDGRTLLTAVGSKVVLWDWPACTEQRAIDVKREPLSAAVSPDGRTALIGKQNQAAAAVIDLATGKTTDLACKLHWFSRVAGFGPDGRLVCGTVGTSTPQAEAWSIRRGLVHRFEKPPQKQGGGHFYILGFAVSPDGRRAASVQSDAGVTVYETASGHVLAHFTGHRDSLIAVAWTPDGNRVLSGGGDHQVLVWDVSLEKLVGQVTPLSADDRRKAWEELGSQPAKEAVKTMAALSADAENTVPLFAEKLKPVPPVAPATLDHIFRELDDAQFAVRSKAERDLNELGEGAVSGVRARAAQSASPEVKRRAEDFLKRFDNDALTPERIRTLRALETLGTMNTPAARKLVEALAAGATDAWETDAARQTLRTMRLATAGR